MGDEILVRFPTRELPRFDPEHDRLGIVFAGEDVVVLRRRPKEGEPPRDRLRLYGEPRAMWAGDLLHALNLNHASGLLVFTGGPVRKEVYLRNGEIVFAQSNLKEDRLGESLVRAGKITEEQLAEATEVMLANPGIKLGKVLVDRGWITPKELFLGVRRQVKEIVWSLFGWPARYLFYEGFADPDSVIALNLATHELIIQGIRRSQQWHEVPPELPEREVAVHLVAHPKGLGLNPEERRVVALAATGTTLRELIDASGLGVLETYKVVHHLLEREILAVAPARAARVEAAARGDLLQQTIHNFGNIFAELVALVRRRVPELDVIGRLNTFFDALPEELATVFDGVRFDADGRLDEARIRANAEQLSEPRTAVLKAFNELLYFTLFEMKNHLSEADTERVVEIIENGEIF